MKITCAASSCKYSSENEDARNTIFISFPNDNSSTVWAHNCGRPDLMIKSNEELHRNYYICSNHIEDRYFLTKSNQLIVAEGAIPTRFRVDSETPGDFDSLKDEYSSADVVNSLSLSNCLNSIDNSCPSNYVDTANSEYENTMYNADIQHEENQMNGISRQENPDGDDNLNFCSININIDQLEGMTIKFTNLCRICGQSTANGINIFTGKGSESKVRDKIHLLLPISIESDDPMPQLMCSDCYEKLEVSHSLIVTSLQTDIRLRKYLNIPSKYNHEDKFRELIALHEREISDELDDTVVSSVEELENKSKNSSVNGYDIDSKTSVANEMQDNQTTIQCVENGSTSTKLDGRLKFVFHPDLNNLLLQPLQSLPNTNVQDNSPTTSVTDNSELVVSKENEHNCLDCENQFQSQCDNNGSLTLTANDTQIAGTATDSTFEQDKHSQNHEDHQNQLSDDKYDKTFNSQEEITSHKSFHSKNNISDHKRRCGHCSLPFSSRKELQNHIMEDHASQQMLFKCGICDKFYEKWSSLDVHEATHRQDKPFLCDLCGKSFKHSNNLRGHKRIHLDIAKKKRHVCEICGDAFRSRFHLGEHMNQHDGNKPYICEQCGKAFSKRIQLRQHRLSHGLNKYACPICGVSFNRRGNMNSHLKRHSSSGGMYTCSVCEYKCKSMSELKMHRKVHSENDIMESIKKKCNDSTLWQCKICTRVFPKRAGLLSHERTHDTNQVRIECNQCGKKLASKNSLKYHTKSLHTSERPHMCQYCGDAFVSKEARLIHERIHTGERPYVCKLCNMQYRCSSNLSQHMKVHSEVRPYSCQYCHKTFTRKGAMTVHERIHTGVKPFACIICDKKFSQKNDMMKHTKTHQNNKTLECAECNGIFASKTEVFEHFETVHKLNSITSTSMGAIDIRLPGNSDTYSIDVPCPNIQ